MTKPPLRLTAILICALAFLPFPAAAADDARALLAESEARHRTSSQEYTGSLVVTTADGKERKKSWRSYRRGYAGEAKLLIRFVDPAEVRGVGFLSLGRPGKNPEQWLYLPSMKRERRIASQDRGSSFIGTDFNYEDMEDFDHSKYDVELDGEEVIDGQPCHRLTATPRDRSGYKQKVLWLRKDILYLIRSESFLKGDGDKPFKRLMLTGLEQRDGHWVALRMTMHDLKKGSHTIVDLEQLAFDRPQPDDRFTLLNLNREEGE